MIPSVQKKKDFNVEQSLNYSDLDSIHKSLKNV